MPASLYRPARNTYQRVFNRSHWNERGRLRELLRPFVAAGSLAFDVGAYRGHYSETLLELGARVVAIEPNPQLAGLIHRRYPAVTVEQAAVGDAEGTATLWLGVYDGHSTIAPEWASAMRDRWAGEVTVVVTTLDRLIGRHGAPAFVKIDVEGHEAAVLAGLSTPVPAVVFEYQCAAPHVAKEAVRRLALLSRYRFALAVADSYTLSGWADADGIGAALDQAAAAYPDGYGDVYAVAADSGGPGR